VLTNTITVLEPARSTPAVVAEVGAR